MEKDISVGKAGELKLEIVGTDAVAEFDTVAGITVKMTLPATALLVALNGAVDAKWPGTKAVADPIFALVEKGVAAAGGASAASSS